MIAAGSSSSKRPDGETGSEAKSRGAKAEEGSAPLMTRMQLNDHKAGMQGLDKEHINQIIYEVSKGEVFSFPPSAFLFNMSQNITWTKYVLCL